MFNVKEFKKATRQDFFNVGFRMDSSGHYTIEFYKYRTNSTFIMKGKQNNHFNKSCFFYTGIESFKSLAQILKKGDTVRFEFMDNKIDSLPGQNAYLWVNVIRKDNQICKMLIDVDYQSSRTCYAIKGEK